MNRFAIETPEDVNVLALCKGEERYIYLFDDASKTEILRALGRQAANVELSLSWADAAVLVKKVRETKCGGKA